MPNAVRQRDLIFGCVAFDPRSGCGDGCDRGAYAKAIRRWAHSVRLHTDPAFTDVVLFTGSGHASIEAEPKLAAALRDCSVRTLSGDFFDRPERIAHTDAARHVHCVVRNRWFVVRDFLRAHVSEYRSVLMSDVRDAVVQRDPFAWMPHGTNPFSLQHSVVFSGEGSGSVRTLRQSRKGVPRTLQCARDASEVDRQRLLETEPLNAGVTLGGAHAFLNFTAALSTLISRVTTTACLDVKDCTDQGLYNLLVYTHWAEYLPHTRRLVMQMERAPSYTLGHKKSRVRLDANGRVLNDHADVPPVVHQFAKGSAGRALRRASSFMNFLRGHQGTAASARVPPVGPHVCYRGQ